MQEDINLVVFHLENQDQLPKEPGGTSEDRTMKTMRKFTLSHIKKCKGFRTKVTFINTQLPYMLTVRRRDVTVRRGTQSCIYKKKKKHFRKAVNEPCQEISRDIFCGNSFIIS